MQFCQPERYNIKEWIHEIAESLLWVSLFGYLIDTELVSKIILEL